MRFNKTLSLGKAIGKVGLGVLGWAVLGAAVGAMAVGLFGVLFGTLTALIQGDLRQLAAAAQYFALCGAVAGILVGGFSRMIDPEGVADFASRSDAQLQAAIVAHLEKLRERSASARIRSRPECSRKVRTVASSKDGECETSTTTSVPATASTGPRPDAASTPVLSEAASAS